MAIHSPETQLSLLERIKCKDETAWIEFTNKYARVLQQWCRKWNLQETDAQDVVQDTLLAVMVGISSFEHRGVGSFRAWMKTIAWRCWKDVLSKVERRQNHEMLSGPDRTSTAGDELEAAFDAVVVQELLQTSMERVRERIEEKSWDVFRLTAIESHPAIEVADRFEMKIDAVYAARCRVQRMITQEFNRLDQER
jgi:RNA polymerase sigma factor (sigma-70 family)